MDNYVDITRLYQVNPVSKIKHIYFYRDGSNGMDNNVDSRYYLSPASEYSTVKSPVSGTSIY